MKNLKVSAKLMVSFCIVVILAIVVGGIGIFGMQSINNADDVLYNENVVALSAMGHIREILQDQLVQLRCMGLNAGNAANIQEIQETLTILEKDMEIYFAEYEATIADVSEEWKYFEAKEAYQNDYTNIKKRIKEASLDSFEDAYSMIFDPKLAAITQSMVNGFSASMEQNAERARETVDHNTLLFKVMLIIEIVVLLLTVFVAVFLSLYLSGLTSKPLIPLCNFMKRVAATGDISLDAADIEVIGKFSEHKDEIGQTIGAAASFVNRVTLVSKNLELMAGGDLTVEVKTLSEMDVIGKSMKQLVTNLNGMFGEIQTATMQVSEGSRQIADGAQALAQGSTVQAATIQELASSTAEIAERTKTNAVTADKTAKLSENIRDKAEKSNEQMNEMIAAVGEISEASKSISKIIKTIDDIAFQTNILALNAAVEAARAGQHGKGFAVVAEEVRNLAFKSAEAARDTGVMIQNSVDKAEFGNRIADETSASLKDIVAGINESSNLISEIARATEEQSFGISQINIGIDQVAQVVQQNSATAEESAASSEEMSGQADMLHQLISLFRLKDGGRK